MAAPKNLLKGFARTIENTRPDPAKRVTISDPDTRGLFVRITPKGAKTFTVVAVGPAGKQVWAAIGKVADIELDEAREKAREVVRRIKAGDAPFPKHEPAPPPSEVPLTFALVRDDYLKRCVRREGQSEPALRSSKEVHRIFLGSKVANWVLGGCKGEKPAMADAVGAALDPAGKKKEDVCYLPPEWNDRPIAGIRRFDVSKMLDAVQDKHGSRQADAVLALLSKMFNWHRSRDEDFMSPIVSGMKRSNPKERQRKRVLNDDEIRTVWAAADDQGTFGAFVKVALLTGQRREKVATMRWSDIGDGIWTIAAEDREKGNAGQLKLPQIVLDIINAQPVVGENTFVFAGRGLKAIAGFSKCKRVLDASAPIPPWVVHDLRRSARSLMSRARVDREIAERVLGHVIGGVEEIYDRYAYFSEKAEALDKLAGLVALILDPPADNVVELRGIV